MKNIQYPLAALLIGVSLQTFSQNKPGPTAGDPKPQKVASEDRKRNESLTNNIFVFEGGDLRAFVLAFKRQLGKDLYDDATIDRRALMMQVPKMKIPLGENSRENSWELVLNTYNVLSTRTEQSLGSWVIVRAVSAGGDPTPNAIVFTPPRNLAEEGALKIMAFSLELKDEDVAMLRELVEQESRNMRARSEATGKPGNFEGDLRYHKGAGLLVASGGAEFTAMAATIVEAFKETLGRARAARNVPVPGQAK
jgi:hypothetical protein